MSIQKDWIEDVFKELKEVIVENETFRRGEKPNIGYGILPDLIILKAKVTTCQFLDKLKA